MAGGATEAGPEIPRRVCYFHARRPALGYRYVMLHMVSVSWLENVGTCLLQPILRQPLLGRAERGIVG